jgi:hypothetical protein
MTFPPPLRAKTPAQQGSREVTSTARRIPEGAKGAVPGAFRSSRTEISRYGTATMLTGPTALASIH